MTSNFSVFSPKLCLRSKSLFKVGGSYYW